MSSMGGIGKSMRKTQLLRIDYGRNNGHIAKPWFLGKNRI